jgi:hypothetical protein
LGSIDGAGKELRRGAESESVRRSGGGGDVLFDGAMVALFGGAVVALFGGGGIES